MKKIKLVLAVLMAAAVTTTASAQFANAGGAKSGSGFGRTGNGFYIKYQGEVGFGFATGGKISETYDGETEIYKTNFSRPTLETIHGIRITDYGFVGLGLGFHYAYGKQDPGYSDSDKWNTLLMPIFVNLKGYYPVNDDFAPFLTLSLGGSAGLISEMDYSENGVEGKLNGGLYCKFGAGLSYKKLTFDFGLLHQGLVYKVSSGKYSDKIDMGINSFYVNVGIKF